MTDYRAGLTTGLIAGYSGGVLTIAVAVATIFFLL
jgi:hypothetical protein